MNDFCEVPFLLNLECSEHEMEKRILSRNSGRIDDNRESLKKRFVIFKESTQPVIEIFKSQRRCHTVSAMSTVYEIFEQVEKLFQPFFQKPKVMFVLGGPSSGKGIKF